MRSIHYLRGLAAAMVVVFHATIYPVAPSIDPAPFDFLRHGVAIFFVISGFVMVASTDGVRMSIGTFARRRFLRVVPFWWLMLTVWVALGADYTAGWLRDSYLFVPAADPDNPEDLISPVLPVGWTLNYEIAFYALFALALALPRRWCVWGLATFLLIGSRLSGDTGIALIDYYTQPWIAEFALGMVIAHRRLRLSPLACPLGLVLMAVMVPLEIDRLLAISLPAAMVVCGARSLDGRLPHWRIAQLLGDASYSIYLSHLIVVFVAMRIVPSMEMPGLGLCLTIFAALALGTAIYRFVEKPMLALLRQLFERRDTPPEQLHSAG